MKTLPKLDQRLAAIASLVRDGACCADIGTDHGYLIAWLAAAGRIRFGYACDIHEKPLKKAAFTLSACGVADKVKLLRCDGLSGLRRGEVDDIVIAGMGGELIWDIIDAAEWTRDQNLHFLLQPMTKPERLRQSLYRGGFVISREHAVISGDFPYTVIEACYTGTPCEIDTLFAYTGVLPHQNSEDAKAYLAKTARSIREKVEGLSKAAGNSEELAQYRLLLERLEGELHNDCAGCI